MPKHYLSMGLLAIASIALSTACTPTATTDTKASPSSPTKASTSAATKPDEEPNLALKAIEFEGKTSMQSLRRGQQAFFLEKNKFANTVDEIGLGMRFDTERYKYEIAEVKPKQVKITATAKKPDLKSYSASVFAIGEKGNEITMGIVCGTDKPSQTPPEVSPTPKATTEVLTCPAGSSIAN